MKKYRGYFETIEICGNAAYIMKSWKHPDKGGGVVAISRKAIKTYITSFICLIFVVILAASCYGEESGCTFRVSPHEIQFFDISGANAEVRVTASAPTCGITANTRYPWITVSVKQEGSEARVQVSVDSNDSFTHRVGDLSVAGQNVTVIQAGPRRGGGQGS